MKRQKYVAKGSFKNVAVATAVLVASSAQADERWTYNGHVYLWGAGIGGTTTSGNDVEVSFSDILDNLEFGIMGSLEARRSGWALFGDAIYLNIADDQDAAVGPGIPASADVDVKGFVFTGGAGYDVFSTEQTRVNGFGGVRYLNMDTTVNIGVAGGSRRVDSDFSSWDAVVGLRGTHTLSEQWNLVYYTDVGAGDSDLTWQVALGVDYKLDNWSLSFGYRHLQWEIDDSRSISDLDFSGPFLGARFSF